MKNTRRNRRKNRRKRRTMKSKKKRIKDYEKTAQICKLKFYSNANTLNGRCNSIIHSSLHTLEQPSGAL